MRPFRFRLERLLELRSHREKEWLARLAEAAGQCVRVRRHLLENAAATTEAFHTDCRRERELDLALLSYRELYLRRLGVERSRLEGELRERQRRKEEVQSRYLEASRDRKILDKVKERRQAEHRREERREEFKVMDDLSSSQFIRARRPEGRG